MMKEKWAEILAIREMSVDQITVVRNVIHQIEWDPSTRDNEEAIHVKFIAVKRGVIDVETLENDKIKIEWDLGLLTNENHLHLIVDHQKDKKDNSRDHQSEEDLILVMNEKKFTTKDLEVEAEIDTNKGISIVILTL